MISVVLIIAFIVVMSAGGVLVVVRLVDGYVNWEAMFTALAISYLMAAAFTVCTVVFLGFLKRFL